METLKDEVKKANWMSRFKELQDLINHKWMRIFLGSFAVVFYTLVVAYISVSLTSKHFHNELEKAKPKLRKVIRVLKEQSLEISRLRRALKSHRPSEFKKLEKNRNRMFKDGENVLNISVSR